MTERKGQKQDFTQKPAGQSLVFQAGAAFGNGFHPSTQAALMAMESLKDNPFQEILDMGCGSGVLSLVAASWWPEAKIVAVDSEQESVTMTRDNANANGLSSYIQAIRSDGFSERAVSEQGPHDLIISNILAESLIGFASALAATLAPNGKVVLSGILLWLLPQVKEAYQAAGLKVVREYAVQEWRAIMLERN